MFMRTDMRPTRSPHTVLGVLLIAIGAMIFAGQLVGAEVARLGWPCFIIVPGAFLLALGLSDAK